MNISIWFSWPAGGGVNTSWLMLAELLTQKWYNILVDKEYASIIKWDNNLIVVYISDDKPFISHKIDYFICFDDYSITKNEKVYELKNIVNLKSQPFKYKNVPAFGLALKILWIDISEWEQILPSFFHWEILQSNIDLLKQWYNLAPLNNDESEIEFAPLNKGGRGDNNKEISHKTWYSKWQDKKLFFWNELIAKWAIASWLDRYSAYPMTPASTLIDVITPYCHSDSAELREEESKNNINFSDDRSTEQSSDIKNNRQKSKIVFFQWEDEIAVSMSMLWAKFAGKRAMCGTSWWWFALMTESLAFSNQAEIWWVYILSQRDGPSTGTPTFTGQWDLDFALNASFGETYPIVIAPDTFENAYNLIWKALNWSDIYQHPVIFLVDKQFSESYLSIDPKNLKPEPINRWEFTPLLRGDPALAGEGFVVWKEMEFKIQDQEFKRYQLTNSWISPYSVPWIENWEFITTSYEHDEYWATNEDPMIKKQMTEKRAQKIQTFIQKEFNKDFYGYEIINPNAKKFFITFWFNRYVLESALFKLSPPVKGENVWLKSDKGGLKNEENNSDHWLIIVKNLQPLDPRLKKRFQENEKNISELTFVEMNHWWTFQKLISNECNLKSDFWEKKIKHIRKYDLYPIFQEEIK